jgi:hypothetical protein
MYNVSLTDHFEWLLLLCVTYIHITDFFGWREGVREEGLGGWLGGGERERQMPLHAHLGQTSGTSKKRTLPRCRLGNPRTPVHYLYPFCLCVCVCVL